MKITRKSDVKSSKIVAADEEKSLTLEEVVSEKSDALEDNFDYVLSGIDKLCREDMCQQAIDILDTLSVAIDEAISQISDNFVDDVTPEE